VGGSPLRWIEISRAERDVLRKAACDRASEFGDLQGMVEGRTPVGQQPFTAVKVLALLNDIGWGLEGGDETYRLRQSGKVIGFLVDAKKGDADGPLADVCNAILSRDSFSDPLIDEALARARSAT
jgi:hypothetical protein